MAEVTVYGIPNCDTCRKARKWLAAESIDHEFHDLRQEGLDTDMVGRWLQTVDLDTLVNRRSRTWRTLTEAERKDPGAELLAKHPTLIKRPVLEKHGTVLAVGFTAEQWQEMF